MSKNQIVCQTGHEQFRGNSSREKDSNLKHSSAEFHPANLFGHDFASSPAGGHLKRAVDQRLQCKEMR